MNILCLRECACISQYVVTPHSSVSLLIIVFVYQIDGYVSRITVRYCRLRSFPVNELRVFPTITPSGFNIGINLNINLWRNFFAVNESPVIKSIKPFIIHEDGVSPGCTRALTTIARFFYKFVNTFYYILVVLVTILNEFYIFKCWIEKESTKNCSTHRRDASYLYNFVVSDRSSYSQTINIISS